MEFTAASESIAHLCDIRTNVVVYWRDSMRSVDAPRFGHFSNAMDLFTSVKRVNTIEKFITLDGLKTVFDTSGRPPFTEQLITVSADNSLKRLLNYLHIDALMAFGHGYPRFKVDQRNRRCFEVDVKAVSPMHRVDPDSLSTITVEIEFVISVSLSSNALKDNLFQSVGQYTVRHSEHRVPLNEVLLLLRAFGMSLFNDPKINLDMQALAELRAPARTEHLSSFEIALEMVALNNEVEASAHDAVGDEDGTAALELYAHQKTNVAWMIERESEPISNAFWYDTGIRLGDDQLPLLYAPSFQIFRRAHMAFVNNAKPLPASYITPTPFGLPATNGGGMLCDEVGLGKTITTLELCRRTEGTTLVVLPMNLLSQWKAEATRLGLTFFVYYGAQRVRDPTRLVQRKLVITTFNTISRDYGTFMQLQAVLRDNDASQGERMRADRLLFEEHHGGVFNAVYHRVVVDESHRLCGQAKRALDDLNAANRWCLSATPAKSSEILTRQLNFLGVNLPTTAAWCDQVLLRRGETGRGTPARLAFVLGKIARRAQRHQTLNGSAVPMLSRHVSYVRLEGSLRADYTAQITSRAQTVERAASNGALAYKYFNEVRRSLSCSSFHEAHFAHMPPLVREDEAANYLRNEATCPICLEAFDHPVGLPCRHVFCFGCVGANRVSRCPLCRAPLTPSPTAAGMVLLEAPVDEEVVSSPKIEAIVARVRQLSCKMLVFSEFPSTLRMLESALVAQGVPMNKLTGSMSKAARTRQLLDFQEAPDNSERVFIMNVAIAATGLNLQTASAILFCEPLVRRDTFEQAVGRIMRIGQRHPRVSVHEFVTEGSLEQRIHEEMHNNPTWTTNAQTILQLMRQDA